MVMRYCQTEHSTQKESWCNTRQVFQSGLNKTFLGSVKNYYGFYTSIPMHQRNWAKGDLRVAKYSVRPSCWTRGLLLKKTKLTDRRTSVSLRISATVQGYVVSTVEKMQCQKKAQTDDDVKRCEFSLYNVHLNCYRFFLR